MLYFYVIDALRKSLSAFFRRGSLFLLRRRVRCIADLMIKDVISLRPSDTLFDALELFAMHRLLAIPVVDAEKRFRFGIVELSSVHR